MALPNKPDDGGRLPDPHTIADVCSGRASKTNGHGYRAWETRRANRFLAAARTLANAAAPDDDLVAAARAISAQLARVFAAAVVLSRGYAIRRLPGARSEPLSSAAAEDGQLVHGEVVFDPSWEEDLPPASKLRQLGQDLATGWVLELAAIAQPGEASALLAKLGGILK
jgi:hypothetical protein